MSDPSLPAAISLPGESPGGTTITVDTAAAPVDQPPPPSVISLRSPKKYNPKLASSTSFTSPPLEWLQATWSVTHSTLPMWTTAKNVQITYKIIHPTTPDGPTLLDDEVTSVPTKRTWMPQPKSVKGIDTPDGDGAWNWRGKGLLKMLSSHWEVLGWGERGGERWVVTWFSPSLFTPAGLDIYCSSDGDTEGITPDLLREIQAALQGVEAKEVAHLAKDMREVEIAY